MQKKFGNTWWGQAWLGALSSIDEGNRLPRGRRYAGNGSILKLQITQNRIEASVQGSQRIPYGVKIEVPAFSPAEVATLSNAIRKDAYLLSSLLNRELPTELLDIATIAGIQLFPEHWDDLDMRCSCADWAVPCKHLAAVVYLVANEIDRNPFLLFQLHKFDILKSFADQDDENAPIHGGIPTLKDRFPLKSPEVKQHQDQPHPEDIDLSLIQDMDDQLPVLLEDSPLFFAKDFKQILLRSWKKTRRGVAKRKPESGKLSAFREAYGFQFILDEKTGITRFELFRGPGREKPESLSIPDVAVNLAALGPELLRDYLPEFGWLKNLLHFCVRLVESAAFIPQLIQLPKEAYKIRWVPALLNDSVLVVFDRIASEMKPGLLHLAHKSGRKTLYYYTPQQEECLATCSVFLNWFVEEFSNPPGAGKDKIISLFFEGELTKFDHFTENEIPATIQNWLSNLYLHRGDFVPVIQVQEAEGEFEVNILVENRKGDWDAPIALKAFLNDSAYAAGHTPLIRSLSPLAAHFPALIEVIRSKGETPATCNPEDFAKVLIDILPIMRLFGISILLPKALQKWARPQATVRIESGKGTGNNGKSLMNLKNMLNFNWQVALGDSVVTPHEFKELVSGLSGLVKIRGQYVLIQKDELNHLQAQLEDPPKLTQRELLQTALAEEYLGQSISLDEKARQLISDLLISNQVEKPNGLVATLRPYQERGYDWMYRNAQIGLGCIIADDMGLGKTIQVISLLLKFKEEGKLKDQKAIAIVPTTLLTNWQKEIEKFAPELNAFIYHGPARSFSEDPYDLCLTTYGVLRSDIKEFSAFKWHVVIIDEAQNIKNPTAAQTKAVKKLKAGTRIAMSGTPVENRLSEYWSIMDFVNKGYLGTLNSFKTHYGKPIQIYHDQAKLETFRKITAPFIMRRLKTDKKIISDLPEKVQNDRFCMLSDRQAALYQNLVDESLQTIEGEEGIERGGLVLKLMMALKQICNHPIQYLKKGKAEPDVSGKTELLMELLEGIHASGEKVLIFTQFREMGELLSDMINTRFGRKPQFLHGGTPRKRRDEMVDTFQDDAREWIFLLSLKAGGTGLNLTAASNVIHYDLWWNPAVEAQATDRAYRIGQNKNVMVYRLISRGTMEEKIDEMIKRKKRLADMAVATGEKWIGELSDGELRELVQLG